MAPLCFMRTLERRRAFSLVKMIATDLDDTLFRPDYTISRYTVETLEKVRDLGIKIVYATARGKSAEELLPDHLFDGRVLMNGALAYAGDTLLYDRSIPFEDYAPFLAHLSDQTMSVGAEIKGVHYTNFAVTGSWYDIRHSHLTDFQENHGPADKLFVLVQNPAEEDRLKSSLPAHLYISVSRDGLAMVMHREAKKSLGLAALVRHFGLVPEEVAAFGDQPNDMDMLEYAGWGIAMANAAEEVRAIADEIGDSNSQDGVARWLDRNVLNKA